MKKLVYFDRMSINICDKDISQASMRHSVGLDVPGRDDGDTWSLDQTPFRDALISGKTILRSDTSDRKYYTDQKYLDAGFRSMMLVPLTYQGTPIGCIALRSKQVGAYSFAEQIILERLAQQIASAVANADLFEQSKRAEEDQRRWGEETSALAAIGRTVSASLDINDVYERLGEEIRKIIPFDRFTIGLVDHENGTTSPTWELGSGVPSRRTGDEIPLAGAFSGEVVRTRSPILLEVETEAEVGRTFPLMMPSYRAGLRSFMAVPLIEHDAVIGVLRVGSNTLGIYSQRLLNLLERIGNQIAGTVANAQLYTDLKRAEDELRQSEVRYRDLYDNTPVMMHSIDGEGNLVSVNDFWLEALGYERGEVIGRRYTDFFTEGSRRRAVEVDLPKFRETGVACDIEYQMQKKTGNVMDVLLSGVSQQNKSGLNHYSNAFIVDVTDRKEAGDKIKASLQEKEVLLKEINHRVKNNLQIIINLLSLQSRDIKDEQTLHSFEVSRNRIRAMALVHDKLYESDDLARIDFGQYINSLALDLRSSYGLSSRDVNLNIDVDSILLGVDTSIPCGVIANELVANSLRHAFPGNRPGEISIRFCLADGQYMMVYKDDGVGFPDDPDIHNPSSMGLTIINALTGQLGGNIERGRKGGADLIITFPAK